MKSNKLIFLFILLINLILISNFISGSQATCNADCKAAGYGSGVCIGTFSCASHDAYELPGIFHGCFLYDCCCRDKVCTPACAGKQCGDNGCEGSCGTCTAPQTCDDSTGKCVEPESPTHKACQGTTCADVSGEGSDECQSNSECSGGTDDGGTDDGGTDDGGGGSGPTCPSGDWYCSGYYKKVCNGQTYVTQSQPSLDCCTDGDCGSSNCGNQGGVWKPQAPNLDIPPSNNYCCGDDSADFGKRNGIYLCVKDGETNIWVKGEEDKTKLNGALLFCNNNFYFCLDNLGNSGSGSSTASACQNQCHYYCELNNKTWVDRRTASPKYLYEALKNPETDKIDKVKNNMAGSSGCCPETWCYDGAKCVEDQTDEACDQYIYTLDSVNYRCKSGNWAASIISYDYKNIDFGFCPSSTDCFTGCGNTSKNYKPDMIATNNPPQCIASNQYYLDYFCFENQWLTRTSLIATKMANSMPSDGNFVVACDNYQDLLNEYDYLVDNKIAERFLTSNCRIHDEYVPCTNNFCLAKDFDSGQLIFGTSLNGMPAPNNPLVSGNYRFDKIIGINGCSGSGGTGEPAWRYIPCQSNIFYNPDMAIVLYSNAGIGMTDDMNGWQAFNYFLKSPINSIINLVKTGRIHYINYIDDTERRFPILNHTPAFGKTFLFQKDSKTIQGVLEKDKHDPATDITQNYMVIDYQSTPNVCDYIWNFTKFTNLSSCDASDGNYTVTDSSGSLYYLLQFWQDLTTKLRMI